MNNYAMVHYPDGNPISGMSFYQTAVFQVDIQNVFRSACFFCFWCGF